MVKADIDKDLKAAMLAGDKPLVEVLRSLKSAILYKEVADGKRDEGLEEDAIIAVLKKERKSRGDAIAIYEQAGEQERADKEKYQVEVIEKYLPEEMSAEAIESIVQQVVVELGLTEATPKDMGRIIGEVKKKAATADGSLIAQVVKNSIN
ncbi:GatB/YqeY domain-containing protein [Candidatus Saccharibacteria bacterium]|nr:GatB/YqeY domain-containing protein [Candidatus Saccharibacteria bacterium]MCA9328300.1 GatB/YqeY domain-containing protein [Candidatus Saccharibacteria bacterium]